MNLPFNTDTVKELVGANLVLSKNDTHSPMFYPLANTVFKDGGKAIDGKWETMDGTLRMLDEKDGLAYEFRALETKNGIVYAVGRNVLAASRNTLHRKVPLSRDFGICVSSHVNYEKETTPVLLRSLKSSGFNTEKVVIVVGGDNGKGTTVSIDPNFGAKIVRKNRHFLGLTALTEHEHMESMPYWLLLHDTCSVEMDFVSKTADIDVGLNPDVVLLRPASEKLEIGIYSHKFLKDHMDVTLSSGLLGHIDVLTAKSNISVMMNTPMIVRPEKDIYGAGVKRETLLFSAMGILKYRGKAIDGGKP